MKIKIFASGEVKHISNEIGSTLISAGLAELTDAPVTGTEGKSHIDLQREHLAASIAASPKPNLTPKFSIVTVPYNDGQVPDKHVLAIRQDIGPQHFLYAGKPELVNAKRTWDGGFRYLSGFSCEVPGDIVESYTRQWKKNKHLRLPDEVLNPTRDERNDSVRAEKDQYDKGVRGGNIPFSGAKG
jgi:hypothetical protein